jgi:hypothetical protein
MGFDILTIRTADDDDPTMYPVLGDRDNGPIAFEALDGEDVRHVTAKALRVSLVSSEGMRKVAAIGDVNADVYVTDSRVAVGCIKWDKGGGWIGTSLTGVVLLDTATHVRAAIRRHNQCLVGHVRYPWLQSVGYSPKRGWRDAEQLRLVITEADGDQMRQLLFDLTLSSDANSQAVASAVLSRAAKYRLAHDPELTHHERGRFQALLSPQAIRAEPKKFAVWSMPTYFYTKPATAFGKEDVR